MPYVELETCPVNEKCVQVGCQSYELLALIECNIYMEQLKRKFNKKPDNIVFAIEKMRYDCDLGFYYEVVAKYPYGNEEAENYAYSIQDRLPMDWDKTSLECIKKFPEYVAYLENKIINGDGTVTSHIISQKVLDAIQLIEENGGVVMIPEPETEILPPANNGKGTYLGPEAIAINHGYGTVEEFISCMNDSIVPACCIYGCQVEPDGICSHNNKSVLLIMGLI